MAHDELDLLIALLDELRPEVLGIGHGRDTTATRRAHLAAQRWEARGGHLAALVSWPDTAASWLRQATKLTEDADTWLIADHPTGWAGIGPRLADDGRWSATRTVAFSSLAHPDLPRLAGAAATEGVHGAYGAEAPAYSRRNMASADGAGAWVFRHGLLIHRPAPPCGDSKARRQLV
ncbi:hypothetical protein EV188_103475 [Actinomycetospora succinea]|uniref:Uncharacterized protein n=1 Tax=Actinomycetospora succinea TaxID=663603 RepID=A0A4R6VF77_9PSEU|nr:hypothetical protein [Actinomycetospora succinea]TDQ60971.1 hypothetical protein EV188_103475 [Actinomycetospora succinea]